MHWIELYFLAVKKLKQADALSRISVNRVQIELSLNDIIEMKNKLFTKIRFLFLIFLTAMYLFHILLFVFVVALPHIPIMFYIWGFSIVVTYAVTTIIFFKARHYLNSLLPPGDQYKIRLARITRLIIIHIVIVAVLWSLVLISFAFPQQNLSLLVFQESVWRYCMLIALFLLVISSFRLRKKFPYLVDRKRRNTISNSNEVTNQNNTSSDTNVNMYIDENETQAGGVSSSNSISVSKSNSVDSIHV